MCSAHDNVLYHSQFQAAEKGNLINENAHSKNAAGSHASEGLGTVSLETVWLV